MNFFAAAMSRDHHHVSSKRLNGSVGFVCCLLYMLFDGFMKAICCPIPESPYFNIVFCGSVGLLSSTLAEKPSLPIPKI